MNLETFWEASMTQLRRVKNNELIDSDFVIANGRMNVTAFFPNITTCEIMVVLEGDDEDEEGADEE